MKNALLLTSLRYLRLRDEKGRRLAFRNLIATFIITALLSAPFIFMATANYFHKDGFVDKVGSFSSVLTGFYVAGLLAVATFSATMGNLDGAITVGRIILPARLPNDLPRELTRREYVCAIFGYLSFLSLFTTLLAISVVTLAEACPPLRDFSAYQGDRHIFVSKDVFRAIPIMFFSLLVAHLTIVTCHGLYYLMDRLYAKSPELLPEASDHD